MTAYAGSLPRAESSQVGCGARGQANGCVALCVFADGERRAVRRRRGTKMSVDHVPVGTAGGL